MVNMQSIVVVFLFIVVITLFSIPNVNGASLRVKKSANNTGSINKPHPPVKSSAGQAKKTSNSQPIKDTKASSSSSTNKKPAKTIRSALVKTKTVAAAPKPKPNSNRQKRLSEWNWA